MTRLIFTLIVVACVSMFSGITFAQDNALNGGTLRGQIIDTTEAQKPIEGVEIKIVAQDGTEYTTKTDANGDYKKAGIPAGRYLINISKDGYGERIGKPVTIVNGGDHFVPLKMSKMHVPHVEVQPSREGQPSRMDAIVKVRIESLLQRVTESVGKRYNLDEGAVKALHKSILDSIGVLLKTESQRDFAKAMGSGTAVLLNMLLAHPACKAAFTEHLSEAQLQDYFDFAEARQQRDQHAAAHQITALLDQELSLTPTQREKVVQLLLDKIENEAYGNAMHVLRISSPHAAAQLVRYRLKISMDGILRNAQSKVWLGLITADAHIEIRAGGGGTLRGRITDTTPAQHPIEGVEVQIVAGTQEHRGRAFIATTDANGNYRHRDIPAGRYLINIYREGYGDRIGKPVTIVKGGDHYVPLKMLKTRRKVENIVDLFVPRKNTPKKATADTAEPQSAVQFAEAKLQAHTELLGPLDEHAAKHLAIAAKGVVQQHLNEKDERHEKALQEFEAEFSEKIEAGEMTREQALRELEKIKKNLSNSTINPLGITAHPIFQQAIKDVLSEEAYVQYTAYQAERRALQRQAFWDIVVACMDTQLLLDNTQRKYLETRVQAYQRGRGSALTSLFFVLLRRGRNFKILTPWQQGEFKRVFNPIILEGE